MSMILIENSCTETIRLFKKTAGLGLFGYKNNLRHIKYVDVNLSGTCESDFVTKDMVEPTDSMIYLCEYNANLTAFLNKNKHPFYFVSIVYNTECEVEGIDVSPNFTSEFEIYPYYIPEQPEFMVLNMITSLMDKENNGEWSSWNIGG